MIKTKILDCTLRDGGYYNDWDFDVDFVKKYISVLNDSGIDIIELGYKSRANDKFYGFCHYCSDSQLDFLKNYKNIEYSFMIDVKDFVNAESGLDVPEVKRVIKNKKQTFFSWCRIATYHETVPQAIKLSGILKELGYKVTFNIMGFSLLNNEQIRKMLLGLKDSLVDVIYISDSFGSLVPEDITDFVDLVRRQYQGPIGIHTHDNQGLAFANTIAAINAGIEYIDASVLGMGRGAGNLRLEQLLLFLYFKHNERHLNPYSLLDIIQEYFMPWQAHFQWGWDFSYMLSGLKNIHPTYCQKLKSSHQYAITQVANILSGISDQDAVKYNPRKLIEVSNRVLNPVCEEEGKCIKLDPYKSRHADSVVILAGGVHLRQHKDAIRALAKKNKSLVLECNDTGVFLDLRRTTVILNRVRLTELRDSGASKSAKEIVTAMKIVDSGLFVKNLRYIECSLGIGQFKVSPDQIIIPSYIVGMFAVGMALLSDPKIIYIAGFEGFVSEKNKDEHKEMQNFWNMVLQSPYMKHRRIISVTPTHYDLSVQSVYSLID
ncbi:MAG: aldolase catalytic domain-containing protein [Candidatus Omnitrophica bacterium]|nr:aldolase catalytic domain-containing protein [Candidatus Omnitrophota bacterium]